MNLSKDTAPSRVVPTSLINVSMSRCTPSTSNPSWSSRTSTLPLQFVSSFWKISCNCDSESECNASMPLTTDSNDRDNSTACSSTSVQSATPLTTEPSRCTGTATSQPLALASASVLLSFGNRAPDNSVERAVRPVGNAMTRSKVETAATSSESLASTRSAHKSKSWLPTSGGSNLSSSACPGRGSIVFSGNGEFRTRRPLLNITAPRCFPRVHTRTTCPRQRVSSALSPQTNSLYPAASVWTTVWQKDALPRKSLETTAPAPASMVAKSSLSTSSSLETSFVTEQPTAPFHSKCCTSCRNVLETASLLVAKSPPSSCRTRRGTSRKEPSSIETGAAKAAVARSSTPSAFAFGRSAMEPRMPRLSVALKPPGTVPLWPTAPEPVTTADESAASGTPLCGPLPLAVVSSPVASGVALRESPRSMPADASASVGTVVSSAVPSLQIACTARVALLRRHHRHRRLADRGSKQGRSDKESTWAARRPLVPARALGQSIVPT
mmetsp:Transcript_107698/g.300079  ORF Transcript_107698/g.300079 Transcript_107698/m.300079 type:complete len:497 (+) Transcript_107698:531-2021(+)